MARVKGESSTEFEVTSGVTLSRTLIPTLPPNFLSRKHLFPLLQQPAPHTTVVLAPAGYGKTSLVAEWARSQSDRVIWVTLTESDTLDEMSSIFIQATRNIIPGFAPWFDAESGIRPVENVRRWGNELLAQGKDFVLVIDNLRQHTARDVDIAVRLIEQFPPNLQFVTIRRDSIETVYATFSSRGPLTVVGAHELAFSTDEIRALAEINGVSLDSQEIRESLESAQGWPSATSLMLHQISKTQQPIDFENVVAAQSDPLRTLVTSALDSLSAESRFILTSLSVIEEFTHFQAEVILGDKYDYDLVNAIGLEGNFYTYRQGAEKSFEFSHLVREILLAELRKDKNRKMRIHAALLAFHENRNEAGLALEHAYLAGDFEKVSELFPDAARIMQATGNGRELIRWSIFAGDSSPLGLLKRSTVELAGHVASQDYHAIKSKAEQMNRDASGTELEGFISQISHGAMAHLDLAFARFNFFEQNFQIAMRPQDGPLMLGNVEQLALLRANATANFILDETAKIEDISKEAQVLAKGSSLALTQYLLTGIKAMELFQFGEYRSAYETAQLHYAQALTNEFSGLFGPLESLFIMARCQWEFGHNKEAMARFEQLRDLAEQWKQWHWHFFADGYIARDLSTKGRLADALENIKDARKRASHLDSLESLNSVIDLAELFIRYEFNDFERVTPLLARIPSAQFGRQIQLSIDEKLGKRTVPNDMEILPARTPRELIWKHLSQTESLIDQEQAAMTELRRALDIGAKVGAKETFLRQSEAIGNLIMKIAGNSPTVYLEDLASGVAERIKTRQNNPSDLASLLTKRELEVLRHLSTDRPISAIATTLYISHNTMKTHLKNLYRKMEVDGRVTAVEKAKANFILR
jgi:LuxR family transcriptional regulator, maltose regulon positive regulatory protein